MKHQSLFSRHAVSFLAQFCAALLSTMVSADGANNFSDATPLTGAAATGSESSRAATVEAGEPKYDVNQTSHRSLWWKWTAPAHGRVTVDTAGSTEFDKYLGVYIAKTATAAVGSLALVHSLGGQTIKAPEVSFPAAAGTVYYIHVCSWHPADVGTVKVNVTLDSGDDIGQLNIQTPGLFANDAFARRAVLTGLNASSIAYNISGTTETSPVEPANGYRTMWWTWTAPNHGRLTISTAGSQTSNFFGKHLAVFLGNTLSGLRFLGQASGQTEYLPQMTLAVTAGQTYQISVGSWESKKGGDLVLTLNLDTDTDINQLNLCAPGSAFNDLFGNRLTLAGAEVSSIGYGAYGTREALEPANTGGGSIWWTYTAPAAGRISLATAGSSTTMEKYLTVWTGGSVGSLTQVARSTRDRQPSLSFNAAAGQTYQISAGAASETDTPRTVVLSLSGPPGPADEPVTGLVVDQAMRMRWPSVKGISYRLQGSSDMRVWSAIGAAMPGDGSVMELYQPVTSAARFFRITGQ